jgi:hypothetical protein
MWEELQRPECSRGHDNTSTDATIQDAIMKTNPVLNEPVR